MYAQKHQNFSDSQQFKNREIFSISLRKEKKQEILKSKRKRAYEAISQNI